MESILGHYGAPFQNKQGKSEGFDSCDRLSNLTQIGFESLIFSACVTLKFDGWSRKTIGHLFYVKLCVSFQIHRWIQTGVTVRKHSIMVKIGNFFFPCNLDGWPWKTIGHLFYALLQASETSLISSSFTGIPLYWKIKYLSIYMYLCIISKPSVNSNLSYSPETLNSGQNRRFLSRVTL